jgi:AcrR family transcriptional regulator
MAIQAAREIIAAEGLGSCSARKVAKHINYTVGTLYNVFDNYDDLLLHVNAQTLDELYKFMKQHIDITLSGGDALKRLAALYIIFVEQHPKLWDALFDHRLPDGEKLPDWYEDKTKQLFAIIESVFEDSTSLNEEGVARAARVLWAGMHGICSLSMQHKLENIGAEPAHILVEHFIDNYMAGIAA